MTETIFAAAGHGKIKKANAGQSAQRMSVLSALICATRASLIRWVMQTVSNDSALSEKTAAVYAVECGEDVGDRFINDAELLLDEKELARAGQFRFQADRRDYIAAHALLRVALSRFADVAPKDWRFIADANGKPRIINPAFSESLDFSLSHTRGLVACAVTRSIAVGVDVERIHHLDDMLTLAKRFFSPSEATELERLSPNLRLRRFFDLWTLKESYIKARGLGLSLPLSKFSFQVAEGNSIQFAVDPELGDDANGWQFAMTSPTPSHRLAYALRKVKGLNLRATVCAPTLDEALAGRL
jgi:4'-phosphopantetheinyl transferase